MMSEAVSKRLYNVKEAGRYLGRSPWTIRRLIRDGVSSGSPAGTARDARHGGHGSVY